MSVGVAASGTFRVENTQAPWSPIAPELLVSVGMKKPRLLIIDDEASVTRTTKLFLEKLGNFEVCEENESLEALDTAQNFRPDVILLDLKMPWVDGGQVAQQFALDPLLARVPIIFFTGEIPEAEVSRHQGVWGGMQFLAKPMRAKALLRTVARALKESAVSIEEG